VAFGDGTLPRSARHALEGRGGDHREAHNVYALAMARAGYEGLARARPKERPLVLARSGWAGTQRYAGVWSGAVEAGWPGLRATLALVLGLGLCGVPYCGGDVGGHGGVPSPELAVRWMQLAALLPVLRTRGGARGGEPWSGDAVVTACAREAVALRERLAPFLYTLAHLAHRTGAPYVRPVWWLDPEDRALRRTEDAFLLGQSFLVAPVLEPGVRARTVRLPRGRWYDTVSGAVHHGPGRVSVEAPLERTVVLARAGAVVPVAVDGGVELEVWAPAPGRGGGGVLVTDEGDGWAEPVFERFTVRNTRGEVVVRREGADEVGLPLRMRGTPL
jgi:alpha-glucosidase